MRQFLFLLLCLQAPVVDGVAADLKPDATTDIPESAKRPVVVELGKAESGKLKAKIPKAELPEGMELTIAAAAPLVTHPIMGCLDDRGRLFMGDCTGVNWNKAQLEKNPPNRVVMLEDTDKDGVYDKSTIFADKMTFPQGACWLDGSLYVCSPPGLWKLTDKDGDGVAEEREMIVGGFEYTGNAADVHGPFLHPNGRLYWCHGRKGHKVVQKDGTTVHEGLASGIWSCKPDGSDVQWHSLACGDNPVEVDFTPEGEIIGTQNLYYSQPRGDTIVHWLYGGVYERADQMKAIQGLPRTLETMPVMYNFGHVAVSGACFARSGVLFGDGNADKSVRAPLHYLVTHFNTQRVVRMELTPDGATYKATEHEFLRLTESPDVHFTDVMEDVDGSVLVVDTGGWFRIGCPSSLMAKPDIAGAVYRVRRKDVTGAAPLAGKNSAPPPKTLREGDVIASLSKGDARARLAACRWIAEQKTFSPELRSALLKFLAGEMDATLEHTAILALATVMRGSTPVEVRTIFGAIPAGQSLERKRKRTPRDLATERLLVRAVAAADVSGMTGTAFNVQLERALLIEDLSLRLRALSTVERHPESIEVLVRVLNTIFNANWALSDHVTNAVLSEALSDPTKKHDLNAVAREMILRHSADDAFADRAATQFLKHEQVQALVTGLLKRSEESRKRAMSILAAQTSGITNEAWIEPIDRAFALARSPDLPLLLDVMKKLKHERFNAGLQAIADNSDQPMPIRLKALEAIKGGKVTPATIEMLQDILTGSVASAAARIQAAEMLGAAPLNETQAKDLAPALATAGPVELKALLPVIKKAKDAALLRELSMALAKNPALASLQESNYRNAFADKPTESFENIVLPALRKANESIEAKKRLLPTLAENAAAKGKAEEGRKHFEMGKGTCIACHKIGEAGRPIGPDLSKIGAIRTERDLIESILFPSNTLSRDYEAHVIETSDGQTCMGVIKSHTAEGLLVVDVAGQEKTVPHGSIVANTTLAMSLMPMGLDGTMTEQELCDLVAWLRSLR